MPDGVLFRVQEVQVTIDESNLPGPTRHKATCARCGQVVRDKREVIVEGVTMCQPCARGPYFSSPREMNWPEMNRAPESRGGQHMVNKSVFSCL